MKTKSIFMTLVTSLFVVTGFFLSCSSDDDGDGDGGDSATSISISSDLSSGYVDDVFTFTVLDNLGNNVTSDATFTVGGLAATNPYTATTIGVFDVIAQASGLTSNSVSLSIDSNLRSFTKKALLEDFTGTWCPNCPPAAAAVATVTATNPNIFGVGYHDGVGGYPDPMQIPETQFFSSHYNVTGFPTVFVNGPDTLWDFPGMSQVNSEMAEIATCGLALDTEIVDGQLNVEVKVAFNQIPGEEVKLMLYLVEDHVTTSSPQAGSSQGSSYVHRDVLRHVYTLALGDVIPSSSISLSSEYVRAFTGLTLPANIDNMDELKVIAYVRNTYTQTFTDYFGDVHVDSPHYDIYNVQEVHMGDSIDFD